MSTADEINLMRQAAEARFAALERETANNHHRGEEMLIKLNCTAGDRAMVVRNTCSDPCMAASVGRYVIVVRSVMLDERGHPRWYFDGPPKPCAWSPFCSINAYRDADLQPLPPEQDVRSADAAAGVDALAEKIMKILAE